MYVIGVSRFIVFLRANERARAASGNYGSAPPRGVSSLPPSFAVGLFVLAKKCPKAREEMRAHPSHLLEFLVQTPQLTQRGRRRGIYLSFLFPLSLFHPFCTPASALATRRHSRRTPSWAVNSGFLCIFSNSRIAVNGRAEERRNERLREKKDRPEMNSLLPSPHACCLLLDVAERGSSFSCGPSESVTG